MNISITEQPVVQIWQGRIAPTVAVLTYGAAQQSLLWQLPVHFATAYLRLLIRLLTYETDKMLNEWTLLTVPWLEGNATPVSLPTIPQNIVNNSDYAGIRPHILYNTVRWLSSSGWTAVAAWDDRPALYRLLSLWEVAALNRKTTLSHALIALLGRLIGIVGGCGMTPRCLRRMIQLSKSAQVPVRYRIIMIRAVTTAVAVSSGGSKCHIPSFFSLDGSKGLTRTISGLTYWPFRNDFGVATWFRAEQMRRKEPINLISVRTDDGGGWEITLVPLSHTMPKDGGACSLIIHIYDAGQAHVPVQTLTVRGCVLMPRVWYHIAIRHTRSRLKGVFSLSSRQQMSVILDGKLLLTEPLVFPKVNDADFRDSSTSLIPNGLRRSISRSVLNVTFSLGTGLDGQLRAMYVFNDNVSDATLRAIFENTGVFGTSLKRQATDNWDSKRGESVRKTRILDTNLTLEDADEMVLTQKKLTNTGMTLNKLLVIDIADMGDTDDEELPVDLQKSNFGSKTFLAWDPARCIESFGIELHVGAHVALDNVSNWSVDPVHTIIGSIGGVQSVVALFTDNLGRDSEQRWLADDEGFAGLLLSTLFNLLSGVIQDSNENARELLRCGGIDVIESSINSSKKFSLAKSSKSSLFKCLSCNISLATILIESMLNLRTVCSRYFALEMKVFSTLLYNLTLWLGGTQSILGPSLHLALLPILATYTLSNSPKVKACVGVRDLFIALSEYAVLDDSNETTAIDGNDRLDFTIKSNQQDSMLQRIELQSATNLLYGIIFNVLSCGVSADDLCPLLTYVSFHAKSFAETTVENTRSVHIAEVQRGCTILLFLLQIRPRIAGLYEGIAELCGSIQAAVGWILSCTVNIDDDVVRSLGLRCIALYLEVTSKGHDSPLSLEVISAHVNSETSKTQDVSLSVTRARNRVAQIAKGIAAMGPHTRTISLSYSKLTARIALKYLWNLLRSRRSQLGTDSFTSLFYWITDDGGTLSASLSSIEFVRKHLLTKPDEPYPLLCYSWSHEILRETASVIGRSLKNLLVIETVFRLLRYMNKSLLDQWLGDFLLLIKSSRRNTSLLASTSDWQSCLFHLVSETLEELYNHQCESQEEFTARHTDQKKFVNCEMTEVTSSVAQRLDRCLLLYATLLGHVVREGGDQVSLYM